MIARQQVASSAMRQTLRKNPAAKWPEIVKNADQWVDDTMFFYGTANRPGLTSGSGMSTLFQFKTFLVNQLEFMFGRVQRNGLHEGLISSPTARLLIELTAAHGLLGMPFVEDADALIWEALHRSPMAWAESTLPPELAYGMGVLPERFGISSPDLSQKIGISHPMIEPFIKPREQTVAESLYPPGISSIVNMFKTPDWAQKASIAGRGIGGPIEAGRALGTGDKEVRTYKQRPVTELSTEAWAMRGAGIPTLKERRARRYTFFTRREEVYISGQISQAAEKDDFQAFVDIFLTYGLSTRQLRADWKRLRKMHMKRRRLSMADELLQQRGSRYIMRRTQRAQDLKFK